MNAGKLYADLSKLGDGPVSTWNGSTNTITWTATSNNMISNFNFAAGNYRSYSTISITVSNLNNAVGIRLQIKANGVEKLVALNGNGTFTKYLTDDFGFTASDLTKVEWIRILGSGNGSNETNTIDADHPASAVISDVYLTLPTRTLDVNLSKMAESGDKATWDFSTKKFAWTLNYSNSIQLPGLSGNLSSFTTINYETAAGSSNEFRILVYYNNGAPQTTYAASVGNKTVNFADMGVSAENLSHVSSINFSGASTPSGDVILNSFSLEGPAVNFIEETTVKELPEGAQDINGMTGAGSIKWNVTYPKTLTPGTGWCGDIDSDNQSVDISSYDYLHFVVTDASSDANLGLRVFVSKDNKRYCLYPHPIAEAANETNINWETFSPITSTGVYVVKISDYPLLRGFKGGNGWQDGNAGTIIVSQAYVISGSPVAPTEKAVVAGIDALNDPNATCFDVTSLPGTGISYNTANPNALFIAKDGQMTNTKNVIIGSTCANLELSDGYPFMAPKNFNATAATYNTTINVDAKAGTLCLPFAAAIPTGISAYTLAYTSGNAATATPVETTIPANTPVLLNGEGSATFTGSGAIVADASNTSGALTGVFENTFVPANSYVLQNGADGVGFYKVAAANTIEAKPFRAYLTATSAARSLKINFAGAATGIENVAAETQQNGQYFDLQGRRVAQPTKGLYIVNGKKMMVK